MSWRCAFVTRPDGVRRPTCQMASRVLAASRGRSVRLLRLVVGVLALSGGAARTAWADTPTCDQTSGVRATPWPTPLDRRVRVRGGVLTLRDALDRVAAMAAVRLSYSDALLPLERRVCLEIADAALGDVLTQLIGEAAVVPRVAGAELVVLAPRVAIAPASPHVLRATSLERVVVTGTAAGGAQRGLSTSLGVVDGRTIESHDTGSIGSFLNGTVPGVWVWQQSPTAALSRYGSIRGASSFGVSYPKIYVDGIEVANPLVVAHVPAESIERLEVLRGPQGAALYGSDAISGVVHVITRQPANADVAQPVRARAQLGHVRSAFSDAGTVSQEYLVAGQVGALARSATGSIGYARMGAFIPDGESHHLSASGRARLLGASHVIDATARFVAADIASSSNPIVLAALGDALTLPDTLRPMLGAGRQRQLRDSLARRLSLDRTTRQSVRQFTGGLTGTVHASTRWTHRGTLGLDTYALDGTPDGVAPLPSSADSALRAAQGAATRVSARASSAGTWRGDQWRRTLTLSTEHALLREATSNAVLARPGSLVALDEGNSTVWRQTNGVVSQLDADWHDRWFVTAGARLERSAGFTDRALLTVLPMLGTAWVVDGAGISTKLRAAYGKGIRPPRATIGAPSITNARLVANTDLEPEQQTGTEFGTDLLLGSRASVHVTRFDQRASGLVQPVTLMVPPRAGAPVPPGGPLTRNLAYQLQNVGAIDNRGWEMEASWREGPVSLHGSYATVDSRVRTVRRGYTGELRPGDRVLDVPGRTFGLAARVAQPGWQGALQVTRVDDWIGYDRIAATQAFATSARPSGDFVGLSLRQFWKRYDAVTRVNVSMARAFRNGLAVQLSGENLLDVQTGEPDNITIVPGRTLSLGVRARF